MPLSSKEIAEETRHDPHLSVLLSAVLEGQYLKFLGCQAKEAEYSISEGCLMFGHRVVKFHWDLLEELHLSHSHRSDQNKRFCSIPRLLPIY